MSNLNVMKKRVSYSGLVVLVWVTIFFSINLKSYSQEESSLITLQNDEFILKMPKASLRHTMADTILPTICNAGQGLIHVETISLRDHESDYRYCIMDTAISESSEDKIITASEFEYMMRNKQRITEQPNCKIQQQWIKDNIRINLESIIKGINTKPLF
jgi:hypothetical protein